MIKYSPNKADGQGIVPDQADTAFSEFQATLQDFTTRHPLAPAAIRQQIASLKNSFNKLVAMTIRKEGGIK